MWPFNRVCFLRRGKGVNTELRNYWIYHVYCTRVLLNGISGWRHWVRVLKRQQTSIFPTAVTPPRTERRDS